MIFHIYVKDVAFSLILKQIQKLLSSLLILPLPLLYTKTWFFLYNNTPYNTSLPSFIVMLLFILPLEPIPSKPIALVTVKDF